jgi:RNA polymerase sigma-70 factor (ECF subfamily)
MRTAKRRASGPDTAGPTLMRRVAAGDPESWARLTEIYAPVVYRWARNAGIAEDLCADITQEVFLTVFRSLDPERNGRFRRWLWRVFRSRAVDRFRLDRDEAASRGGTTAHRCLLQIPEEAASIETDEGRQERQDTLVRAVLAFQSRFEPCVWECFWRTAILGEPPKAIATDLGVSVWAVYKARARCQERLQRELALLDVDLPTTPVLDNQEADRGREDRLSSAPPPSEPDGRFSRIRLSG